MDKRAEEEGTAPDSPDDTIVFGTVGRHVRRRVPVVTPTASAADTRRALSAEPYDCASHVAVCDGDRLLGLMRVEDVLAAPDAAAVTDLMDPDPPVVNPGVDQEVLAWTAVRHGESGLAVADDQGRFVGLVPPSRIIKVLLEVHDAEMARIGGFLKQSGSARHASEEPVARRFAHRLPWLLVGLAGAVLAAGIVGMFERQLSDEVLLVFFVPGIVYMADAVGTQTEALVIRGLSVGVSVRRVVRLELLTGLSVGLVLALVFLPVGALLWGRVDVAVAVAIALFFACSTATVVAMFLPWLFQRLGRDPAFGSGPLATVAQDLLSLVIYFAVASVVVG